MKTFASISFRVPAAVVRRLLPTSLAPVFRSIRDDKPIGAYQPGRSSCYAEIDPTRLDEIVAWGEWLVEPEGEAGGEPGTLIRVLNLEEKHGREDLPTTGLAEVLLSDEVDDTSPVRNWKSVYRARWECSHCHRLIPE